MKKNNRKENKDNIENKNNIENKKKIEIKGTKLSNKTFVNCSFSKIINVKFYNCIFKKCDFTNCEFANCEVYRCNFLNTKKCAGLIFDNNKFVKCRFLNKKMQVFERIITKTCTFTKCEFYNIHLLIDFADIYNVTSNNLGMNFTYTKTNTNDYYRNLMFPNEEKSRKIMNDILL